jgi:hypothetical protein
MFISGMFETPFRWIGKQVLGFNYKFDISGFGSGDNTYAYIVLFVNFFSAIVLTALWSIIDNKRKAYNTAFYWFLVGLRFFLIAAMLLYGFVKVFQIQFQPPSFTKLLQPLGEFSPMGLAWTYMGYSKGFGMFAGLMEISGGLLLIYRRTSTLGAFIIIGVMTQVAMMNLMFDIPVKIFSIHLILIALVIFMTDIKRFVAVFIKNKAAESYAFYHPNPSQDYHKIIVRLKLIVLPIVLIGACILGYLGQLNVSDENHRPFLYGIWETKVVVVNNDTLPPLTTDKERWRYLIIERKGNAVVKSMTDELTRYNFKPDTLNQKLSMYKREADSVSLNLSYRYDNKTNLRLQGILENDTIDIQLTKKDLKNFPLKSRGFHWINERPYNR